MKRLYCLLFMLLVLARINAGTPVKILAIGNSFSEDAGNRTCMNWLRQKG